MHTELEAKFFDINPTILRQRLRDSGAVLVEPERLMRRRNYDYPDLHLEQIGGWVRIRDEGNKLTLSYKQLNDRTLHGTKEVNLTIDSFKSAEAFLAALGLISISYQETRRESWLLDKTEIEIDTWPWIPPFVELEAGSEAELKHAAHTLALPWNQALHGSVEVVYQQHYDVTEAEVDHWPEITFIPVPTWLEIKRKTGGHHE